MNNYTLSSGVVLTLQRPRPLLIGRIVTAAREQWLAEHGDVPPIPTYEVTTAAGEVEIHEHNETTLDDHPEDRDAYYAYIQAKQDHNLAGHEASLRACLIYGVVEGPDDAWRAEREYWRIPIPEHPNDAKIEWLEDISASWDELLAVALTIQMVRDPVEAAAQVAADLFRSAVEGVGRDDAGGDQAQAEEKQDG